MYCYCCLCVAVVVEVRFSQSEYTFSEGDNPGTVNVEISREIAKDLQVNVFGSKSIFLAGGCDDYFMGSIDVDLHLYCTLLH